MKKSSILEKLILELLIEKMQNITKQHQVGAHESMLITEICTHLISKPEIKKYDFSSALINASNYGHVQAVKEILKFPHIDPNSFRDPKRLGTGMTALICASKEDRVMVVRELLEHPKIDPNGQDGHGYTALMYAASWGNTEIAQELLRHPKIDPNVENIDGDTALSFAEWHGRTDIIQLLYNHPKTIK